MEDSTINNRALSEISAYLRSTIKVLPKGSPTFEDMAGRIIERLNDKDIALHEVKLKKFNVSLHLNYEILAPDEEDVPARLEQYINSGNNNVTAEFYDNLVIEEIPTK